MRFKPIVLATLATALAGCAADSDDALGERTDNLFVPPGVGLWSPGQAIRVCWVTVQTPSETLPVSGLQSAKDAFRLEIKNSWERWANISFIGFDECPTAGTDRYIRVQIAYQGTAGEAGGACYMGTGAYQLPSAVSHTAAQPGLSCGVGVDRRWTDSSLDAGTRALIRSRWQYVAVHEFGHVLGFGHEQDRGDNPTTCPGDHEGGTDLTAYDYDSVMNYCGSHGNWSGILTPDDIRGVIRAYGRRIPGPAMYYNGFEGSDASAWWIAGHGGVDLGIGWSRTGANNGWIADWQNWNALNTYVRSGGAGHRCDVEVQTRLSGAPAQNNFWIYGSSFGTGWFDWPADQQNFYRPVKFSFDATEDSPILVAGFWGNNYANHFLQADDVTVNCSANLSAINFDNYWQGGISTLVSADHLSAGGAHVRYDNVPVYGGGYTTVSGNVLTPSASHTITYARDMALSSSETWCTTDQLSKWIYATIIDGSGTTSPATSFPARWLCSNG